jgi:hypothetical protein
MNRGRACCAAHGACVQARQVPSTPMPQLGSVGIDARRAKRSVDTLRDDRASRAIIVHSEGFSDPVGTRRSGPNMPARPKSRCCTITQQSSARARITTSRKTTGSITVLVVTEANSCPRSSGRVGPRSRWTRSLGRVRQHAPAYAHRPRSRSTAQRGGCCAPCRRSRDHRGCRHVPPRRPPSKPDTCVQTTSNHHVELARSVEFIRATEPSRPFGRTLSDRARGQLRSWGKGDASPLRCLDATTPWPTPIRYCF